MNVEHGTTPTKEDILSAVRLYCQTYHSKKSTARTSLPYTGRVYDEDELVSLVDSALEFWLTSGRYTEQFESGLSDFLGVPYCSFVNSDSSANLLAFMALTVPELGERAIRRGDEVITLACGFPTTVAPMIQYGAVPAFLDVAIPSYNVDVRQLEDALSSRTKAVMIAHTLGNPFDLAAVREFCDRHQLWLVEDNCDALGAEFLLDGVYRKTGTVGDIGTSSFYPAHHITTSEGGAVYTSDPALHRIVRSLRDWGRACACPQPFYMLSVWANGDVAPCDALYKACPLGNVKTSSLRSMWESEQKRSFCCLHLQGLREYDAACAKCCAPDDVQHEADVLDYDRERLLLKF